MSGFIAMQREALEHPLFRGNPERFYAWFWLVARAAWKPTPYDINGKTVTIERGQLCASRSQLATAWNWSPSAVERFLTRLETEQMIGRATGQGRTVITICNYAKYQDAGTETGQATEQPTGQPSDSDRTTKEPLNQLTNVKIDKPRANAGAHEIPDDWQPMAFGQRTQSRAIVDGWPTGELAMQAEHFAAHHRRNGNKFKNWQEAWSTWVLNSRKFGGRIAKPTNSRNSGSPTLNAVQRAIQLTGGSTRSGPNGSGGCDGATRALPDPLRSIGHERG